MPGFFQNSRFANLGRITALLTGYRVFTGQLLPVLSGLRLMRHRKMNIVRRWQSFKEYAILKSLPPEISPLLPEDLPKK
jgi:hypothetical protein